MSRPPTTPFGTPRREIPWGRLALLGLVVAVIGGCLATQPWKVPGGPATAHRLADDPVLALRPAGAEPTSAWQTVADRYPITFGGGGGPNPWIATAGQYFAVDGAPGPVLRELDADLAAIDGWVAAGRRCSRLSGEAEVSYVRRGSVGATGDPGPVDVATVSVTGWPEHPSMLVTVSARTAPEPSEVTSGGPVDLGCLDAGPLPAGTTWPPATSGPPAFCRPGWTAAAPSVADGAVSHLTNGPGCSLAIDVPGTCPAPTVDAAAVPGCPLLSLQVWAVPPAQTAGTIELIGDLRVAGDDEVAVVAGSDGHDLLVVTGDGVLYATTSTPASTAADGVVDDAVLLAAGRDLRAALRAG